MSDQDHAPLILVAEDEAVTRDLIVKILSSAGYSVVAVEDGVAALEVVRTRKIRLAVLDQMMEPMGGIDFVHAMHSKGTRIPAIMVTAHDVSDFLHTAWRAGVTSVLRKPIDPERLIDAVGRALRWKEEK